MDASPHDISQGVRHPKCRASVVEFHSKVMMASAN
jgi:hypothetical protein